jgi:DNA-binding beta-propeller fold protein YncE
LRHRFRLFIVAIALFGSACGTGSHPGVAISNTTVPAIAGAASFDVVDIDQAAQRLYAADRTDQGIDVFDTSVVPARFLKTIALKASPNGLAVAPELQRVFAGTSNGSVAIVDVDPASLTADEVVKEVPTGGQTVDLLDYSSALQIVFASNGDAGSIASIDATTGVVKAHFAIGHALEQPRYNPADGMLYVTSPDADAVFEVDPGTGVIKSTIKLGRCYPHGLAINPKLDQALIACRDFVIRQGLGNTGDVEAFGQVTGGDVVSYDAVGDRFLVATPAPAATSAVGMFGGNPITYLTSVTTGAGGNSAAYDEANHLVYTPDIRSGRAGVAGFEPPRGGVDLVSQLPSLGVLVVVLAVITVLMLWLARWADPVHRPAPAPATTPSSRRERA